MWNTFPIQTPSIRGGGSEFSIINRSFKYKKFSEVQVKTWKEYSDDEKKWCISIWKKVFGYIRDSINDEDCIGIIPEQGTILARNGIWIDNTVSTKIVYVNYLYVDEKYRNKGIAGKLIQSICAESSIRWGDPISFFFELQQVPKSLSALNADIFSRFSYIWIPFLKNTSNWKVFDYKEYVSNLKGFRWNYKGWKGFKYNEDIIIFDSHNDIVWYTSFLKLIEFDGLDISGAYCRVFSPFGNTYIYAENSYFIPKNIHYVLP